MAYWTAVNLVGKMVEMKVDGLVEPMAERKVDLLVFCWVGIKAARMVELKGESKAEM